MTQEQTPNRSLAAQVKALHHASESISKSMATVPESQLHTALLRGFRVWPYGLSTAASFLVPTLQIIADEIRNAVSAELSALGVGHFPRQPFDPWVISGVDEEHRIKMKAPCPVGILGTVAIQGKKIRTSDIHALPDFKGFPPDYPQIKSFMALPIRFNNHSLGNLYVGNKIGKDEFTEDDEQIAEILARMAGSAIQQAHLQSIIEVRQSQVQALLDSVPTGVLFLDQESRMITANSAAMELFQRSMIEPIGEGHYHDLILTDQGENFALSEHPSTKVLAGQTILGQELEVKRVDSPNIPVRLNAAPVLGPRKEITGAVFVFENISLEKSLEVVRQQMAQIIVHDIRNPIQAAMLAAQAITNTPKLDSRIINKARIIERSLSRVTTLASRLLEVAQIESAQINLDLQPVELKAFVAGVTERASAAFPERRFDLRFPQDDVQFKLDLDRMDQVLTNLIDNAAKYSPEGKNIEVILNVDPTGVEIAVRDYGPGIAPEELNHLFEPYKRGDAERTKSTTGLGLGLFIVRGIVEAHGGKVAVESKLGEGSVFRLRFPASLRDQVAAA